MHFSATRRPLEAIASSLTELFAPNLHEERIAGMLAHYDFVNPDIMSYFSRRMQQAPRDANFALDYVKTHANTPEQRHAVCNALLFKTNVLWVQLDALYHAYVDGHVPPGAFVPKPCRCRDAKMAGSRSRNIRVSEASRPVLPRHARLKFDETRQVWVILAPERVLAPDEFAVEC